MTRYAPLIDMAIDLGSLGDRLDISRAIIGKGTALGATIDPLLGLPLAETIAAFTLAAEAVRTAEAALVAAAAAMEELEPYMIAAHSRLATKQ